MKTFMKNLAILGGMLLLSVACVEELASNQERYRPAGTEIVFSASTGYENGLATRVEYSGDYYYGNNGHLEHSDIHTLSSYSNVSERIDWEANDQLYIYYSAGGNTEHADYNISSSISPEREISYAGIQVANNNNKLVWSGASGTHVFTAMYPRNGYRGNSSSANTSISFNGTVAQGLIPANQTPVLQNSGQYDGHYLPEMKYAYLLGYAALNEDSTESEVYLPFSPAFTAFEFLFQKPTTDASYKVKSFTMSSSSCYLAGNFSLTITGGNTKGATWNANDVTVTNGSRSITMTFPGNGVDLSNSSDLDFTILTLPKNLTDITLSITYNDGSQNGVTKSLALSRNIAGTMTPETFVAGKKYIITNKNAGLDGWDYILEEIPNIVTYGHKTVTAGFQVRSYKQNKLDNSIKVPVAWKIQYIDTTALNPTWIDIDANGVTHPNSAMNQTVFYIRNSNDTGDGFTGAGSLPTDPYEVRTSKIYGEHNSSHTDGSGAAAATRAKLASAPQRGTSSSAAFDLSIHPTYGAIDTPVARTTANSYVVSAPGYYMFPCVYGNAISGGSTNVSAYNPSQSTESVTGQSFSTLAGVQTNKNVNSAKRVYYTPGFYNVLNGYITDPWIKTDLRAYDNSASFTDAVVVWQDTNVGDEIMPYNSSNIGLTTVTVDGVSRDFIWFYIDKEDIKPGNILIALRGRARSSLANLSGTKDILWSWQIWVTEKDLTPTSADVLNGYYLMPYNLGWIDSEEGSVVKYNNRGLKYRVLQVENGVEHEIEEFTMTQIGDAISTSNSIGGNPYYQWGRKDPFLSALPDGTATSRPVSPNSEYSSVVTATGAVIPAAEVQDQTTDYSTGISHPYVPYNNTGGGVGSTSWIGGPVYPYKQKGVAYESFYFRNTMDYVNHQRHFDRALATAIGLNANPYPTGHPDFGFIAETRYDYWCHNGVTGELLTINQVDAECYDAAGTYGGLGKTRNDFYVVNGEPYTASQRSAASCPYNLWNSYLYDEDATNAGTDNKFKTVYDPCPPGFTVPVKDVFAPGVTSSDFTWSMRIEKRISPAFATYSSSSQGVTFGNSFFPFTGARIYFTVNYAPELRVTDVATDGMYWTDCAHTIDFDMYFYDNGSADQTTIGYYSLYHSAISFDFTGSENYVKSYTRGSALSMRPMVDPKY